MFHIFFFFFSSRRRHTRLQGDWSSDVCSSDLFVGDLGARALVRRSIASFRKHAQFPSEGVAAPAAIPGVSWSDHWAFRKHGYPAIMVTDTAFYRYPHYHLPSDTPEKLDYERMARVTLGLAAMLRDLLNEAR